MKILVDINHPAQVHLFRNAIAQWREHGHLVRVTARDKDVTLHLLNSYGIEYKLASVPRRGLLGMVSSVLRHDSVVLGQQRKYGFDVIIGTSFAAAHISKLSQAKSVILNEDDHGIDRLFESITYPFADFILTPDALPRRSGNKQVSYRGYQKLAYLHPNHFTPNPAVLGEIGLEEGEPYSIVRLVALQATHDINAKGLTKETLREIVARLSQFGRVFISSEKPLEEEFRPYQFSISPEKMHDLLAHASLYIGDSQSMSVEAAVLGVPGIRCSSFVGRISVLEELEHRYQLTYGVLPSQQAEILHKLEELLKMKNRTAEWQSKRARMLAEKIDVTAWLVEFVESLA